MVRQRDPIERAMESALQPGRFIAWNQESALVSGFAMGRGLNVAGRPSLLNGSREDSWSSLTSAELTRLREQSI
jgi:hypothetical protein